MGESATEKTELDRKFDALLTGVIGSFLGSRGFTQSENAFRRRRGELHDMIGFQANWNNGTTPSNGYFINVGVGSVAVDTAWSAQHPGARSCYLLDRRWESLVDDLPYQVGFNRDTDMAAFGEAICEGLGWVIDVLDEFTDTATLVRHAVENNFLIAYEETCCYLAAVGDVDTLAEYVGLLRYRFGAQDRWKIFNSRISAVTCGSSSALVDKGLLDPVEQR